MSVPIRHTPCSNTGRRPCHCETVVVGVGVVALGGVCRMEVPGQVVGAGTVASQALHVVRRNPSLRTAALHTTMHPLSAHSHSHDTTGGRQGCCCSCCEPLRLGWDTLPSTEGCPRLPTQCIPIARHCNTWEAAAWGLPGDPEAAAGLCSVRGINTWRMPISSAPREAASFLSPRTLHEDAVMCAMSD